MKTSTHDYGGLNEHDSEHDGLRGEPAERPRLDVQRSLLKGSKRIRILKRRVDF